MSAATPRGRGRVAWVVSDGRAGIEGQALGLAEALDRLGRFQIIRLHAPPAPLLRLRAPHVNALDPVGAQEREQFWATQRMARQPWPEVWIGCGRASLAFSRRARAWSGGASLVVQLQRPPGDLRAFDLVVPPLHDGLAASETVMPTLGSLNRIVPGAARPSSEAVDALPRPRAAVLIGGTSKRHTLTPRLAARLLDQLDALASAGVSLMITTSRRTPGGVVQALRARFKNRPNAYVWSGDADGPNPYFAMLGGADMAVVTMDSTNMLTEAATAGLPILGVRLGGRDGKFKALYQALEEQGRMRPFTGAPEIWPSPPLAETDRVARRILALLDARGAH